jgi:hypothetical protein
MSYFLCEIDPEAYNEISIEASSKYIFSPEKSQGGDVSSLTRRKYSNSRWEIYPIKTCAIAAAALHLSIDFK